MNRILSALLAVTMLCGQFMVGDALAAEPVIISPEDGGSVFYGAAEGESALPVPPAAEAPQPAVPVTLEEPQPAAPGPVEVVIDPHTGLSAAYDGAGEGSPSLLAAAAENNGGLSVLITSGQTQVSDGDLYIFSVSVQDTDLTAAPNISEGETLTITLPPFLSIEDTQKLEQNCGQYFSVDSYNENTHTLVLRFKEIQAGSATLSIGFSVEALVDASQYDGNGRGTVEIALGETEEKELEVVLDTGVGGGETTPVPYIRKVIWRNGVRPGSGNGVYVLNEAAAPVGYTVSFGVMDNYTQNVHLTDDLSGGALTLCDSAGTAGAALGSCIRLYIDGSACSPSSAGETLVYQNTALGTIEICRAGTGIEVTCSHGAGTPEGRFVNMAVQYYALVSGNINDITNTAALSVDGESQGHAQTTIRRFNSNAAVVSKYILHNGTTLKSIDIEEDTELTFRLVITQYGTGTFAENAVVVYDILEDCFRFLPESVTVSENGVFSVAADSADPQKINITKQGSTVLPTGNYTVEFKVRVLLDELEEGGAAFNTVGDSRVRIRRKAKLIIDKTWSGTDVLRGDGARFVLYNGGTAIADSGAMRADSTYVLYINAQNVQAGTHTYMLRETVDEDSGYAASRELPVVITKAADETVSIVSVDGEPYDVQTAHAAVVNRPDSGLGSLIFRKFGGDGTPLAGGTFRLWRVGTDGAADALIETFTTADGEYRKESLPYGTYYVEEVSAPAGYLLAGEGTSARVTLKKTEPHRTVSLTNTKFEDGRITIRKLDENGAALAGVTFTLTDGANVMQQRVTGADGVAVFENLPAGQYSVTETLPFGYAGFAGPLSVTIDTSGALAAADSTAHAAVTGSDITVTWENTQQFGALRVEKYRSGTEVPLAGAVFALYQNGQQVGESRTTGSDGAAVFPHLAYGTYLLRETEPPAGYVVSADLASGVEVQIGSTDTVTYTFYNGTRKGSITLTKRANAEDGAALAGAVFGLYADASAETLLHAARTGANGRAIFAELEAGTYYIREIAAPTGYRTDAAVHEVTVGGSGETAEWEAALTVVDLPKLFRLRLLKTEETGARPLQGAEFTLTGSGILQTAVSDADGFVTFDALPYGTYTVTETRAPEGYLPAAPRTVTLDDTTTAGYAEGQTVTVSDPVRNAHTRLTVCKFDDNGTTPLPDAQFRIRSADGQYVLASAAADGYVFGGLGTAAQASVFTTGSAGTFVLQYLPLGSYTLEELTAPAGYLVAAEKPFVIAAAGTSVSVNDTQIKARLKLVKTDGNGKLLAGVGFVLRRSEGEALAVTASGGNGAYTYTGLDGAGTRLYTDSRGELTVSGLLWGTYYLDEVETPAGLVPQTGIEVEVTAQQHDQTIALDVENPIARGDLAFKKTDGEGSALSGAVFKLELVAGSGNRYSAADPIYAVSDAEGRVVFRNIPYGVYRLTEYLAPANHVPSAEVRYVSIAGAQAEGVALTDPETLHSDWVNAPQQREFTVRKVSSTDGAPLSGAVFEVLDGADNKLAELAVNGGVSEPITLPVGEYFLRETRAPENYILSGEKIPFKVTEQGTNEVTVRNAPVTGALTVRKTDAEGRALAGAEFIVMRLADYEAAGENAEILYTLTTDSSGTAVLGGIPFGSYAIRESRAPQGYELSDAVQTFTVTNAAEAGGSSGEQIELSFVNEKSRYLLCIRKVDIRRQAEAGTDKYLSGATFAVYGDNFYTTVTTAVTAENPTGAVLVEVPAIGTYTVTELAAPVGFTVDPAAYTVEVTGHSGGEEWHMAEFVSLDYPTAVRLYKVDENGAALSGAGFMLFAVGADGETPITLLGDGGAYTYAGTEAGTLLTVPAGGSLAIYELPEGAYLLRETEVPDGYLSVGDIRFEVRLSAYGEALELTVPNFPLRRGIAVCKQNESGVRLAGAVFALYAADGGEPIETVTTAASGYAAFSALTAGSYYIVETAAPAGYAPTDTRFDFAIDGEGAVTSAHAFVRADRDGETPFFVLTVVNAPTEHSFRIRKVSAANADKPLAGAIFRLAGSGIDRTYTTGADGLTEAITLPIGSYTLSELKAPDGYVTNGVGKRIEVLSDGVAVDGERLTGGEAAVLTVENPPQSFRLRILKRDKDTQQALGNVAFTLVEADGTRHSLVTDGAGYTEQLTLAPGTYAIGETVAAIGYNLPLTGWSFTVAEGPVLQVTEVKNAAEYTLDGNVLTLVLENERIAGELLIRKSDAEDGAALAGAAFEVTDGSGRAVRAELRNGIYTVSESETASARLVTDETGRALLCALPYGEYTVREIEAPTGYALDRTVHRIRLTAQSETVTVEVPNRKLTRTVSVRKLSAGEAPEALIGAVFTLYAERDGARVYLGEATTGYDGKATFELPYGRYIIAETRAPIGYELSTDAPIEFTIDDSVADGETLSYTVANEKTRYGLEIYKYDDADEQKGLAGAVFAVTDGRGYTKTVTTDASGRARLADIEYDDYTIREISAPAGYRLSGELYRVGREELLHGKVLEIRVPNTYILGKVALKKVDREDPTKQLEGAEFTLTDQAGQVLTWRVDGSTYTLDEAGDTSVITAGSVLLEHLPEGQYTLHETKSPDGYVCLDEARTFSVTAENFETVQTVTVENLLRRTAFGLIKLDENDLERRLAGAEFTLYRLEDGALGAAVATAVTDGNGLAVFTDLVMGTYRLLETKAPDGYKLWGNPIDISVDAQGIVRVGSAGTELPAEDTVYVVRVTNRRLAREVTLKKVSAETGTALSGATFRLSGERTLDITTGADGTAKLTLPYGSYLLEELIAPNGYVAKTEKLALEVGESGLAVNGEAVDSLTVTVENDPVEYRLIVHKQSAKNGKPLAGASFTLYGAEVFTLTTNSSGNSDTVWLKPGVYTLSEIAAPKGYRLPLTGWKLIVSSNGNMTVEGAGASIAMLCGNAVLTVENTPTTPVPPGVAKTGQTVDPAQLLGGALLMLLSFVGFLWLALRRRRRFGDLVA